MAIITLTTDFGTDDWFVGTMKGVILGIHPSAHIVDLNHQIPPGSVLAGAFSLSASHAFFPKGTIHVAVVDPGVGSGRSAILVQTSMFYFVGPDNGVLSLALEGQRIRQIRRLENPKWFRREVSHTFHGRDVFAPVAAHMSRGVACHKFGHPVSQTTSIRLPETRRDSHGILGEIVYLDRFGNAITNITSAEVQEAKLTSVRIASRGCRGIPIGSHYQSVAAGKPVALIGSTGRLEIAIHGGSAVKALRLGFGDAIRAFASRNRDLPQPVPGLTKRRTPR